VIYPRTWSVLCDRIEAEEEDVELLKMQQQQREVVRMFSNGHMLGGPHDCCDDENHDESAWK
jgi:hypothetical protein